MISYHSKINPAFLTISLNGIFRHVTCLLYASSSKLVFVLFCCFVVVDVLFLFLFVFLFFFN